MSGQKRSGLTKVEIYDGNAKRPSVNQLSGTDSTVSQAFWTGRFSLTTAGVAEAITAKAINPGIKAVIRSSVDNTENIYLGYSTTSAAATLSSAVTLIPGESFSAPVDNFSRIFIYAAFDTSSLELTLS